jgi:hypothetical protein
MLDAFVSNWMRRAAAEAGYLRRRQFADTHTQSENVQ